MLPMIQFALFVLFMCALASAVYHSIRYRREKNPAVRFTYQARTNISMGIMLIIFAIALNFFFTDSVFRRIFATMCVLIGIFNFYVGLRNLLSIRKR